MFGQAELHVRPLPGVSKVIFGPENCEPSLFVVAFIQDNRLFFLTLAG